MDDLAYSLLDYVCRSVSYKSDNGEFWYLPSETLARGVGDCDDTAILLCSLLRHFYPPDRVYVVVGTYRGLGHAWCLLDGEILETTYTYAHVVPDPQNYRAFAKFNDQETVELWPRAMTQLFQLARNESQKLALMAEATGNEVPPECPSLWLPLIIGMVMGGIIGVGFAMYLQKGEKG